MTTNPKKLRFLLLNRKVEPKCQWQSERLVLLSKKRSLYLIKMVSNLLKWLVTYLEQSFRRRLTRRPLLSKFVSSTVSKTFIFKYLILILMSQKELHYVVSYIALNRLLQSRLMLCRNLLNRNNDSFGLVNWNQAWLNDLSNPI